MDGIQTVQIQCVFCLFPNSRSKDSILIFAMNKWVSFFSNDNERGIHNKWYFRPLHVLNFLNVFDLIGTHFLLTLRVKVLNTDTIFAFKTSLISTDTEKHTQIGLYLWQLFAIHTFQTWMVQCVFSAVIVMYLNFNFESKSPI